MPELIPQIAPTASAPISTESTLYVGTSWRLTQTATRPPRGRRGGRR